MSGPKYSTAVISDMARLQQLARELEERIENSKRLQLLSDIAKLDKEKKDYIDNSIIDSCRRLLPEARELIPGSAVLQMFERTLEEVTHFQEERCNTEGNSQDLVRNLSRYKASFQKMKNKVAILEDLKERLSEEGSQILQRKKVDAYLSEEWRVTREEIDILPDDLRELYYDVLSLLAECPDYDHQKSVIDATIMAVGDLKYKKRQLELRKSALIVEQNQSQDQLDILSLEQELKSLYRLIGGEEKPIPLDAETLKESIKEARSELARQQKADYIAKCVHKVFADKGYNLIEDSVLSAENGTAKRDYYEYGEDSMVNVSMSDRGQMLFEVVGRGDRDRMDESRASKLESEMRRFCPDYDQIKKALHDEYGIELESEHLCAPDKKYARAVDMAESENRRRGKTEKKLMYYED